MMPRRSRRPRFFARQPRARVNQYETKGQEDLDVPRKMERPLQWCGEIQVDVKCDLV